MLKIALLSCSSGAYSTRRLREACVKRGYNVKVLHTLRFSLLLEAGQPALFFRNKRISRYDAVIPRIGASISGYGTAVLRQFEQMGVFSLNSSDAILRARDKLRAIQLLVRHQVGVPPTAFARDRACVLPAIEAVGGAPIVIKLLEGSHGIGVILAETTRMAEAIIDALRSTRHDVLVQRFVHESRGRDLRAFVVGDRVVAAVSRRALADEFRANVHRGGSSERVLLEPAYARVAVRAAQIMGLRVAGVDMLDGSSEPQVLEVNSSPGLEGIENATGVDVAGEIVAHLAEQIAFPDVDLRQRLTLSADYGVIELPVRAGAGLAGKTLADLGLDPPDVQVLSLIRGTSAIPNPARDELLVAGDSILCFGRYATLRRFLSETAPGLPS